MKHLTKFETLAEFQAVQATLDRPNVSLIEATMGLNYLPYVAPVVPQHDYVEIGGIKWATMNVGAESITDYGFYFQWGDTQGYTAAQVGSGEGQKYFAWADYKYNPSGDGETFTKYNNTDGKTVLDASDDAVTAVWGGNWRMPTGSEFQTLGAAVNAVWTTDYQDSGVAGLVCTDKTDSSKVLFFPDNGTAHNGNVVTGTYAMCWSSSISDNITTPYMMLSGSFYTYWKFANDVRKIGHAVRGILDE